ncbi:TIGR03943 family putative permease subunit [Heliorestis convoluta]|uniref:TIGR03943 family protein n=1 Tax=Heliorestis convoluta TaxID=356322 RepID=A0A5Q2MVY8_9FIRM|nr:TIGR03943 family protein [Heliorestis convoluta]QGG46398.1 hypothetical protein FTV88_0219 [Heliorestis convoluta]
MKHLTLERKPLLQGLLLLLFSIYLWQLYFTGNLPYYIHPRYIPFTVVAANVLTLLALYCLIRSIKSRTKNSTTQSPRWPYAVFSVMLLLGFLLPPQPLDLSLSSQKNFRPFGFSNQPTMEASTGGRGETPGFRAFTELDWGDWEEFGELEWQEELEYCETDWNEWAILEANPRGSDEQPPHQGTIVFTDLNFVSYLTAILSSPQQYYQRHVEIEGFVYREGDYQDNHFVLGRYAIVCCIADASVVGLLAISQEDPDVDSWIKARGTIIPGSYQGFEMPVLQIERWEEVQDLPFPYVYAP